MCSSRISYTNKISDENTSSSNDFDSSEESDEESNDSSIDDEIFISINEFPVNIIALESCNTTLDDYILNNELSNNEWESIILQILFTLIIYQKVYDFTHNDLHTNNIVYIETEKKYLYYKYNNKHYKVNTFGKIYKIIDFGRAIYKFKNKQLCSDSFYQDGDAFSQYNFGPFYNNSKKIVKPNPSFDLCRLGCSIFDYLINDISDILKIKSPIKKIIISWIFDDNNKNILYKNNGDDRYPDFKLYKMISRTVTKHIPSNVLKNELFNKYIISKKNINKSGTILNIDELPILYNNID